MGSVRRRLTLVLATGFVVLTAGAGLCLDRVVASSLTAEFDEALSTKARTFRALTEQERDQIELDYTKETMPEFERAERPEYFQFWLDDGTVLLRSKGLGPAGDLPRTPSLSTAPSIRDVTLPDGRPGRVVQFAYVPRASGTTGEPEDAIDPEVIGKVTGKRALILAVARGREALDRTIGRVRTAILAVAAAAALLAVLLVWRALSSGFRPIDEISAQVERLDADRLGTRVDVPGTPRELARVVGQLNALLGRIEGAVERERRFTGNVAHELRTPIAELRALAAVGTRWPGDEASVEQYFRDVEAIAGRMERLVADLLLLARCQAGVERVERRPTSLREVVATAWSRHARAGAERGLRVTMDVPEDLEVETDASRLGVVLSNLLGNAVSHSRQGGEVRCVALRTGSRFQLDVANDAEPLDPEDLLHLTEPFWRKDSARSSEEHSGLGLALVAALGSLLRLEIRFSQDGDGTFRVRLDGDASDVAAPPGGGGDRGDPLDGPPKQALRWAPEIPSCGGSS